MEKTDKKGRKIAILSLCGILCGAVCIAPNSVNAGAFATENNDPYFTWLTGCEMSIDQTATTDYFGSTLWTDNVPLPSKLSNNVEDSEVAYNLYQGNSQQLLQLILPENEYRLRITPISNTPETYIQDIRISNEQTQIIVVDYFLNSVQNTTAGVKTNEIAGTGLYSTFVFDYFNYDTKQWQTHRIESDSKRNGDGNFWIVTPLNAQATQNVLIDNNAIVTTEDGVSIATIRNIEWTLSRKAYPNTHNVLGINISDTFTVWNYYQRNGIAEYRYTQLLNSYKPSNVNLTWAGQSGLFGFVSTFFEIEIFPDFTIGTLLFVAVGGLLVGMLLKIFLGG